MEVVFLDCTRTWSTFWGLALKTFDEKSLVGNEILTNFGISSMLYPLQIGLQLARTRFLPVRFAVLLATAAERMD